jgi:hypothetical protein
LAESADFSSCKAMNRFVEAARFSTKVSNKRFFMGILFFMRGDGFGRQILQTAHGGGSPSVVALQVQVTGQEFWAGKVTVNHPR